VTFGPADRLGVEGDTMSPFQFQWRTTMRRTFLYCTMLALVAPAAAAAQAAGAAGQAEARAAAAAQARGFSDAAAEARVRAAIEHAASVGVPQVLLERKIAEGRAKGVADARIAAAVERRAEAMARVMTALQRSDPASGRGEASASAAVLMAATDAHELGVDLDGVAAVYASAGNDRAVALSVLADLVADGRTPQHALVTVQAALARGGNAIVNLGATVPAGRGAAAASIGIGADAAMPTGRPPVRGGATVRGNVRGGGS
jgi:hypothetical protein